MQKNRLVHTVVPEVPVLSYNSQTQPEAGQTCQGDLRRKRPAVDEGSTGRSGAQGLSLQGLHSAKERQAMLEGKHSDLFSFVLKYRFLIQISKT